MNHPATLLVHGVNRWLVLITAAWVLARCWRGVVAGAAWTRQDQLSGLAFTTILNVQLLLEFTLYLQSPITRPIFTAFAHGLSDWKVTFFALIHPSAMISAVLVAQAAYSLAK